MAMPGRKHRVEISADPHGPEKIVIHCREVTDDIRRLQAELEGFEFSAVGNGAGFGADNTFRKERVDNDNPTNRVDNDNPTNRVVNGQRSNRVVNGQRSNRVDNEADTRLSLKLGGQEHLIAPEQILFFESEDGKVAAHTAGRIYRTEKKLYELEEQLPKYFMRVSKACVLNLKAVSWLKREFTGPCRVGFAGSDKQAYVSRMYYKPFREKLDEMNGRGN